MAVHFGNFDVVAVFEEQMPQKLALASSEPCPPTPTIMIFFVCMVSSLLHDGGELAKFLAYAAADALGAVDDALSLPHADGGAAELHARLAAPALVRLHMKGRGMLDVFQKRAGAAADDDGRFFCLKLIEEHLFRLPQGRKGRRRARAESPSRGRALPDRSCPQGRP